MHSQEPQGAVVKGLSALLSPGTAPAASDESANEAGHHGVSAVMNMNSNSSSKEFKNLDSPILGTPTQASIGPSNHVLDHSRALLNDTARQERTFADLFARHVRC
jgi:hypothetical protein